MYLRSEMGKAVFFKGFFPSVFSIVCSVLKACVLSLANHFKSLFFFNWVTSTNSWILVFYFSLPKGHCLKSSMTFNLTLGTCNTICSEKNLGSHICISHIYSVKKRKLHPNFAQCIAINYLKYYLFCVSGWFFFYH